MPCWCSAWPCGRRGIGRVGTDHGDCGRRDRRGARQRRVPTSSGNPGPSRAVTAFAKEIAALLSAAAEALEGGPIPGDLAAQWLEDARRLTRQAPRVERALAHAEQSRRLNLRALRHPPQGGLRSSLDALEHTSISMRTLFRAMHDATQRRTGVQDDPDYATHVRCSAAVLMADMATVLWAFGRCAHGRAAGTAGHTGNGPHRTR